MTAQRKLNPERLYKFGLFIEKTVFLVIIFGIGILFSTYFFDIDLPNRDFLFLLSATVAIYTLLYHHFVYFKNPTANIAFLDTLVYSTFIFLLNHMTGGLSSPLFFIYLLPIISVRLNLGSKLPLASTIFIAALIFLELFLQSSPSGETLPAFLASIDTQLIYLAATEMISILLVGIYIRSISIELTHEYEQFQEIERLNEELQRIDRGKDEFISIAGHEIRTPLTALRGGIAALISGNIGGKLSKEQKEFLEKLQQSADRLTAIAEDSLNISALEKHRLTLNIEPFDLLETADHVMSQYAVEAKGKKITLTIEHTSATLPKALGDEKRIETVLHNLLDNALKFTPAGGSVTIKVRSSGGKLVTSVSDTGVGIPEEEVHNLFRKFYRVESVMSETTQGTGLGLYIVKLIMNLHGETVGVESELGKGSTFTFTLKAVPH